VRFVVVAGSGTVQHERVLLLEELLHSKTTTKRANIAHYTPLAQRAIWAILAPFGWDEEEIAVGRRRVSLKTFSTPE
jgi:hypothetical protein